MLISGVGTSANAHAAEAASAAITEAQSALNGHPPQIALVFASSTYDHNTLIKTIKTTLGDEVQIIGGSTAGEISTRGPSDIPSVVIMLLAYDQDITATSASLTDANEEPEAKGRDLAKQFLNTGMPPELILMVADGLKVNPSAILRGMGEVLPEVPVVGGSAGDDGKYKQTFQFSNDAVLTSGAAILALYGKFKYSIGVRHGWNPISSPKIITKATGTVINEIDHKPALELYKEFIGEEKAATLKGVTLAKTALSYPLGIKDEQSHEMLLRAPFYVDDTGSITCGGEVFEGASVQLMMGSKESAIEAAKVSAMQAMEELGTTPKAALIFNCHVRDTLFASKVEAQKEFEAIREVIGQDVPVAGFYTYAEQAPVQDKNYNIKACNNVTHNETIVILLLAE